MTQVTEILSAVQKGDKHAAAQLLPLVYSELRKLAASRLARESSPQTLNATALVHEAYLRLVGTRDEQQGDGRGHFFAAAAEAMRRILVDSARHKQSLKHGDQPVHLNDANQISIPLSRPPEEVIAISDALETLSHIDAQAVELVKLRYFTGFTIPEAAKILNISPRTADNLWSYSRAWLAVRLRSD